MYSKIIQIQKKERKTNVLTNIKESFFKDCNKYCKTLEENKQFQQITNVKSIVNEIKQRRLAKILQKVIYNIDKAEEITNLTSLEKSLIIDLKKSIERFEHYSYQEEEI